MTFKIITAEQRVSAAFSKVSMAIFGPHGVGKTRLALTLDPATSLFIDLEAGTKSLGTGGPTVLQPEKWEDLVNLAVMIGGPDPAAQSGTDYSAEHYQVMQEREPETAELLKGRRTIFVDSITDMTRQAFQWAKKQPEALSEKKGTQDTRAIYGMVGTHCVRLLRHLQHAPGRNVIFVGLLDRFVDNGRENFEPQTEGSKTARELPGIVDQVITMSRFVWDSQAGWIHTFDKAGKSALCCQGGNPWGLPAKDRGGLCELIEEPDLGKLIHRLNHGAD